MKPSRTASVHSQPTTQASPHSILTGKLQKLPADEQEEMQGMINGHGEAYVLKHWNLLLSQIQYFLGH